MLGWCHTTEIPGVFYIIPFIFMNQSNCSPIIEHLLNRFSPGIPIELFLDPASDPQLEKNTRTVVCTILSVGWCMCIYIYI